MCSNLAPISRHCQQQNMVISTLKKKTHGIVKTHTYPVLWWSHHGYIHLLDIIYSRGAKNIRFMPLLWNLRQWLPKPFSPCQLISELYKTRAIFKQSLWKAAHAESKQHYFSSLIQSSTPTVKQMLPKSKQKAWRATTEWLNQSLVVLFGVLNHMCCQREIYCLGTSKTHPNCLSSEEREELINSVNFTSARKFDFWLLLLFPVFVDMWSLYLEMLVHGLWGT